MKAALLVNRPAAHRGASTRRSVPRLWQFSADYLAALPAGALAALVWANLDVET